MSRRDVQGLGYNPDVLRELVRAYSWIIEGLAVQSAEANSLEEKLVLAGMSDEIRTKRESCYRRLAAVECHRHAQALHARSQLEGVR